MSAYLAPMPRRTSLILTAVLASFLPGCGGDGGSEQSAVGCAGGRPVSGRPIRIATTLAPITSIVANIAGGSGSVVAGLVPEGVNSHTYEPSPSAGGRVR